MHKQTIHTILRDLPLFATLSLPAFSALEALGRTLTLVANQTLYHKGDSAHAFYIILKGAIRLVDYTPEGRAVHIKVYGVGDCFGLLAIAGEYPHTHSAQAIEDSIIFALRGDAIRQTILQYPEIGLRVIDALVNHVHEAHERIGKQFAERVEQRLATALLHYAQKFGTSIADGVSLDVVISQQALADFIGTTIESVNRTLSQWGKQGLVRVGRLHIDLLDVQTLHHISSRGYPK